MCSWLNGPLPLGCFNDTSAEQSEDLLFGSQLHAFVAARFFPFRSHGMRHEVVDKREAGRTKRDPAHVATVLASGCQPRAVEV